MTRRSGVRARAMLGLVGIAAVALAILATPTPAGAHAVLVSSTPAAGSTVGTTPATVVLTFDEPLAASLSHATVVDPAGRRFTTTVSGETMRAAVSSTEPGVYLVTWTTVSEVDGHTITGGFEFGVGVAVAAGAAGGVRGPTAGDVAVAVLRGIEFTVLLLACGLVALRRIAGQIAVREPAIAVAAGILTSAVAVVVAEVSLATRPSPAAVADYLSIGMTGFARLACLVLSAALLVVAVRRRRLSPVLVAGIVVALAAAGHAANIEPTWFGVAVNALHVGAAGVWAGGIMALALQRLTGNWQVAGRPLLSRFARVAPWAFVISAAMGALEATQLLGDLSGFLDTSYGRALAVKGAIVAAMTVLSALAWRRRPMVRAEATLAVLVVAAAAVLTAFPVVPKEAREAAEEAGAKSVAGSVTSPFPRPGDLTMAGRAGDTLVALTVRPGRPGRNQIFAYVAPDPAGTLRLTVDGTGSDLVACGESCRSGTVDLRGGQPLSVRVGGAHGGTAKFTLPALPAPDGTALARRATRWMAALRTYRVDEYFSGIHSTYAFAVPHQMWLRMWLSGVAHESLWLGTSLYKRGSPAAPWSAPVQTLPVPVPYLAWKPFQPIVDAVLVGSGTIDGVPARLVSFFGGHGDDPEPVWFTLWIDTSGNRVLRSQMWAPGHLMDDRYSAFNEPVEIPRPPDA